MEVSVKSVLPLLALLLTGLSAGFFVAWSVSVIPGHQKVSDGVYLESMQWINRAILNPLFFLIFFGSAVSLGLDAIYQVKTPDAAFYLTLAAFLCYLAGTVAVTGLANVPLNNQLDALSLSGLTAGELKAFREFYEMKWNRWHQVRTVLSVVSFVLIALSVVIKSRN